MIELGIRCMEKMTRYTEDTSGKRPLGAEVMQPSVAELKGQVKSWSKRLKKTSVPNCIVCDKPMVMAYDSILKRKSKYLWKFDCNCHPSDLQLVFL